MTTSLLLKSNRKLYLRVLFVFMTVILLLLASPVKSHAAEIQVVLDGTPVSFDDSTGYPFLDENDRTLVPMRAVMEACGCTVYWNKTTQTAVVMKENVTVKAVTGQNYIYKNDQRISNDSAAIVINDRTYLPIRVVLESFGYTVEWDEESQSVIASSEFDINSLPYPEGYDEFISHFDITTKYYPSNEKNQQKASDQVLLKYKDSNNREACTAFLESYDQSALTQYATKLMNDNYTEGSEEIEVHFYVDKPERFKVARTYQKYFHFLNTNPRIVSELNKLEMHRM